MMGRDISGDFDHKFWFAVQPSSDILEFGGQDSSRPAHSWSKDELPSIESKVAALEQEFRQTFDITVDEFFAKINAKDYQASSHDPETQTQVWAAMSVLGAKIELGRKIRDALAACDESIEVEYET
jgi:hypothetical protein